MALGWTSGVQIIAAEGTDTSLNSTAWSPSSAAARGSQLVLQHVGFQVLIFITFTSSSFKGAFQSYGGQTVVG